MSNETKHTPESERGMVEYLTGRDEHDAALLIETLVAQRDELAALLRGVIAVSDRKTDEYDRARAALAKVQS